MVIGPSTSCSADTLGLVSTLVFSMIVPQLTTKVADEDTSPRPITGAHAILVQMLVDQFVFYMGTILPIFL